MGEVLVDALRGRRGFVVNPRRNGGAAVESYAFLLRLAQLVEPASSAQADRILGRLRPVRIVRKRGAILLFFLLA